MQCNAFLVNARKSSSPCKDVCPVVMHLAEPEGESQINTIPTCSVDFFLHSPFIFSLFKVFETICIPIQPSNIDLNQPSQLQ